MVVSFGLFQLTYFPALLVLGPLVAKDELGGAGAWGTILAVESARGRGRRDVRAAVQVRRPLVACQLLGRAVGPTARRHSPSPLGRGIAAVSFAPGSASRRNTLWMTSLQRNVPEHALSRISSFDWLGSVALNPVGYALIGPRRRDRDTESW